MNTHAFYSVLCPPKQQHNAEISSVPLVAVLTQPRRPLAAFATRAHYRLMIHLVFHQVFPAKLLCIWSPSACLGVWGYSPGAQLSISICSTSCDSCHPIFPACWCPYEWQHNCLVYQQLLPVLDHLQTCWRCPLLCSINKVIKKGAKPSQPQSSPSVQDAFLHNY